ncbi:MAG: RluA family pseudouridine synthase [Bdellovibrionales bacterium]|nr:RluA family pseudouridine synthase [Bdellovibrionales bacterium]
MPPKKVVLIVPPDLAGSRLDVVLASMLPASAEVARMGVAISKGKVRKLVMAGAVYLNSGRVRIASKACRAGARIDVYIDPAKLSTDADRERGGTASGPGSSAWKFTEAAILFEDEWILGVNKPAGLPTQPTLDEARANLYALLQKFLRARDGADAYVGLHHRLDRDTSGAMVFTKKKAANAEIGRAFAEHLAKKTYLAIVASRERTLPDSWTVENYLAREKGKSGRMTAVRSGGDRAITDFRTLLRADGYALVEAKPRTGRMHQIRVHLSQGTADVGPAPIVGDRAYGGPANIAGKTPVPRVMLHAAALTFPHPITNLEISFTAPPPADFETCSRLLFGNASSNGPRS